MTKPSLPTVWRGGRRPGDDRAAIVAFDPLRAGWVTATEAAGGRPPGAVAVPDLDGELTTGPAALAVVVDDVGPLVHRAPLAVRIHRRLGEASFWC